LLGRQMSPAAIPAEPSLLTKRYLAKPGGR
jgi:hypothetical protein